MTPAGSWQAISGGLQSTDPTHLAVVADARIAQTASAAPCSIATIAAQIPIDLSHAGATVAGSASAAFALQYPRAITISTVTVKIHAPTASAFDGRTVTAIFYTDDTVVAGGGPAGRAVQLVRVACGVAFYDPATGDFAGGISVMADAPPVAN